MPTPPPPLPAVSPPSRGAGHPGLRQRLRALPYVLRIGLANVLFSSGIGVMIHLLSGQPLRGPLVYSLCIGLSCWALIDGSRQLCARLLRRWRPEEPALAEGWPGWPVMLVCVAASVPLASVAGSLLAQRLLGWHLSDPAWSWPQRELVPVLMLTLVASMVATALFYARGRLAAAHGEAEQARRLAAETQLRLLESQLEPHMLFNTLANLRVLISLDPTRAQAMLDRLIAFLRATLDASRRGEAHSLRAEFARLADYLALMEVRMGPRLQTRLDLPEALAELPVPPLLLQPLVENAIKHGLEPKVEGGCLTVSARQEADQLRLEVLDSGVGPGQARPADQIGSGFGLEQVRSRLATQYGPGAGLRLDAAAEGGTRVSLWLPLSTEHRTTSP
jgi:signal transduction histidine kinase